MHVQQHEPIIIELDDPTPRWYRWGIPLGAFLALALFITPWFLDTSTPQDEVPSTQAQPMQTSRSTSVCQPTVDIPSFAQLAASMVIPGWMRLCDWFAEPAAQSPTLPADPAPPPRFNE